ncbi:serine protease gd-like isoform X2 [Diabrotica undecimpunctata]
MKHKYGLAFLLIWMPMMLSQRIPPNPCKKYFSYYKDLQGRIYGEANLPYDNSTSLVFSVNSSFSKFYTNRPKLKLELLTKLPELNDGTKRVIYNIFFPFPDVIPKITGLTYNGNTYCVGQDEPLAESSGGITNVWAQMKFGFTRQKPGYYEPETLPETSYNDIPLKSPDEKPTDLQQYPANTPDKVKPTSNIPQRLPESSTQEINTGEINDLFFNPATCGVQDKGIQNRILGATDTKLGQYPWLVAFFWQRGFEYKYKCSATLISNKHVLTAARCFEYNNGQVVNIEEIFLVMGTNNLAKWNTNGAVTSRAKRVDVHPKYKTNSESADGDIAIILLDRPVQFTDVLSPVCLWNGDINLQPLTEKKMGVIVGFGQDENSSQKGLTHVLRAKRADMPIVTQNECFNSPLGFKSSPSDNTFCTRSGDTNKPTGPCKGDTGAGFFVAINDIHYLRGIASAIPLKNDKCDFSTGYVAFCDAFKFKGWIDCKMNDNCY